MIAKVYPNITADVRQVIQHLLAKSQSGATHYLRQEHAHENVVDTAPTYCFNISCFGDVAQLGERSVRNAEAEGSNPFISTMVILDSDLLRVFF